MNKNHPQSFAKLINDFLPLIIFFLVFKFSNNPHPIIPATLYLILSTLVILIVTFVIHRRIAVVPLLSAIILGIFGGMTIFFDNEIFIKIKPTIVNLIFAIILLVGGASKKPLLKYFLGSAINIPKEAWLILSYRWGGFFIFLAILNEIIWRNFSTENWVQFKVFGILPISIIFALVNMPYIIKQMNKMDK